LDFNSAAYRRQSAAAVAAAAAAPFDDEPLLMIPSIVVGDSSRDGLTCALKLKPKASPYLSVQVHRLLPTARLLLLPSDRALGLLRRLHRAPTMLPVSRSSWSWY
jgi:hypothetical protein